MTKILPNDAVIIIGKSMQLEWSFKTTYYSGAGGYWVMVFSEMTHTGRKWNLLSKYSAVLLIEQKRIVGNRN